MNKQTVLTLRLELLWWIVTGIILLGVLFPIYNSGADFPFWKINIIFIVVFITLTRYLFLLKHTFLGYIQWAKVVVLFLCIPLIIFLIGEMHTFQQYIDEIGLDDIFAHLSLKGQVGMVNYVRSEMLLFGVGAIIAAVLTPFRMLISFWRLHNRGTV
jgi:hypothetical protein